MLGHPGRIARATVVSAMQREGVQGIDDRAQEAILQDTGWVDGTKRLGRDGLGRGHSVAVEEGGGFLLLLLLDLRLRTLASRVEQGRNTSARSSTGRCNSSQGGLGHGSTAWRSEDESGK